MHLFDWSKGSMVAAVAATIAGLAIACGGGTAWSRLAGLSPPLLSAVFFFGLAFPLWTPVVFLAFAAGRGSLTPKLVLAFAVAEAAAVGVCYLMTKINW